jgi:FMN-dependent NADH-azoreductase
MKLLHVDSSILGQGSVSRILSAEIAATQKALHPGLEVPYRDLAATPIGHLTGAHLAAAQGAVPADAAIEKDIMLGEAMPAECGEDGVVTRLAGSLNE